MHMVETMGRAPIEGHGEDAGSYLQERIADVVYAGDHEEAAFRLLVAELVRMHQRGEDADTR